MTDFDVALAKKQLARELKILVIVQVVALCIAGLGLFPLVSKIIPNYPAWDTIHSHCGVFALCGMVVSVVFGIWGCLKLTCIAFLASLPYSLRAYLWGIVVFLFFLFLVPLNPLFEMFFCALILYCVIPQFFIARWLASEAKEDSMKPD